ncbi:hypothetical protein JCM10212_000771 [Sporobolomyces blumeae]
MFDDPALTYPTPHPTPVLKFESPPASSSLSLSPASDPTSSTSPSPPLDLCERIEDVKPIVEGPPKRTTPCDRCRQVRRACRWDEGSKSCVRCSEAGIACSGPKRRSRPAHEMIVSVAARRELPVVEIGPSSPESRWSTLHLSYSLQYHLVDVFVDVSASEDVAAIDLLGTSCSFGTFDLQSFIARYRLAQGRHEAFDEIDQLFALSQMAVAGRFTNHSAFLRRSKDTPSFDSISGRISCESEFANNEFVDVGLARHPLTSISVRILDNVAEQLSRPFANIPEAIDKLEIVLFVLTFVEDSIDFAHETLAVRILAIQRGIDCLHQERATAAAHDRLHELLKEAVAQELSQSISLGVRSSVSPRTYRSLFGEILIPAIPVPPGDLWFLFDPANPLADAPSREFYGEWIPSLFEVWGHLDRVLAFAPTASIPTVLRYCLSRTSEVLETYATIISQIAGDPRMPTTTHARPRVCLHTLIYDELEGLRVLRSRPAHEMIVSVAARRELPVVEIGPSSPESRWSTVHLAYSLQYHLLDVALPHTEGISFDGLDFESFLCRFRSSLGRNDEFDSLEQLFALDLMVLGGHSTNHSAFLRTASPVPELASLAASTLAVTPARYAEIGLSRQQPLLFLVREIVRQAFDHLSQPFDTSERAVTVISAVALAVNFVKSAGDIEDDCLDLVELAVRRGLEFVQSSIPPLPPEDSLFEPLNELTFQAIRQALCLGRETNISPSAYYVIFDRPSPPAIPSPPDDVWYIFRQEDPASFAPAMQFQRVWLSQMMAVNQHLDFVLAFAPTHRTTAAIAFAWSEIDRLLDVFDRTIQLICRHPLHASQRSKPRPWACIQNLVNTEFELLPTLWACHVKLKGAAERELLVQSTRRFFDFLDLLCHRLALLEYITVDHFRLQSAGAACVETVRYLPAPMLREWARTYPFSCARLVRGLRFACYGMPDACRLLQILDPGLTSANESTNGVGHGPEQSHRP